MKASELIEYLKQLILEHGDLYVIDDCDESIVIYFDDSNGEPAFIVE